MWHPKPDHTYLHDLSTRTYLRLGDVAASITEEETQVGEHQEYEWKLLPDLYKLNLNCLQLRVGPLGKSKN